MKKAAILTVIVGLIIMAVAWSLDTTVGLENERVHNIGLMDDRRSLLITGAVAVIAGVLGLGFFRNSVSNDAPAGRRQLKRCMYCASDVFVEAKLCRYCGREFPLESISEGLTDSDQRDPKLSPLRSLRPVTSQKKLIGVAIVFVIVISLILSNTNKSTERSHAKTAEEISNDDLLRRLTEENEARRYRERIAAEERVAIARKHIGGSPVDLMNERPIKKALNMADHFDLFAVSGSVSESDGFVVATGCKEPACVARGIFVIDVVTGEAFAATLPYNTQHTYLGASKQNAPRPVNDWVESHPAR